FTSPSPAPIYTLSLHDALPIYGYEPLIVAAKPVHLAPRLPLQVCPWQNRKSTKYTSSTEMNWNGTDLLARYKAVGIELVENAKIDRKSTRLNSSHDQISYAVFC